MIRCATTSAALVAALTAVVACSPGGEGGPPVARVVATEESRLLVIDDTHQFSAVAQDAAGQPVNASITWSSTSTAVASVTTGGLLTAKSVGDTKVIARSGEFADTVNVTVLTSVVTTVTITMPRTLIKVSDTVRAEAVGRDLTGNIVANRPVTWTTSDPLGAVVTPFGLVLGVQPRPAVTISATIDGVVGTKVVTVVPADVGSIIINPNTATLAPGATTTMQATVFDEFGGVDPNRTVVWSSFLPSVASIDQNGLVTAQAEGTTTIRATTGGVVGEATVIVSLVANERFRIEVTNYLAVAIEVEQNGVAIGQIGANSTGVLERPLTPTFTFSWAVIKPQGHGESFGETAPTIANPTGTVHFDVDNVLANGKAFFTPIVRNLSDTKVLLDFMPKTEANPCICPSSPEDLQTTNLGYWVLDATSLMRVHRETDFTLTGPRLNIPVPSGDVEARSGIWRVNLTTTP